MPPISKVSTAIQRLPGSDTHQAAALCYLSTQVASQDPAGLLRRSSPTGSIKKRVTPSTAAATSASNAFYASTGMAEVIWNPTWIECRACSSGVRIWPWRSGKSTGSLHHINKRAT